MIGFAESPGTEVEPTCSIVSAMVPKASRICRSNVAYARGHSGL